MLVNDFTIPESVVYVSVVYVCILCLQIKKGIPQTALYSYKYTILKRLYVAIFVLNFTFMFYAS